MYLNQMLKSLGEDMGINLGRRDIAMAEKSLQRPKIGATRQKVGGK
jgi:hypothetical protein